MSRRSELARLIIPVANRSAQKKRQKELYRKENLSTMQSIAQGHMLLALMEDYKELNAKYLKTIEELDEVTKSRDSYRMVLEDQKLV